MRRIYEDHAYGQGPVTECYWDTTVQRPERGAAIEGEVGAEVAILGAGYTGLSAALHLARDHGANVAVVEANGIGWGASGRNGGFATIGGTKASEATLLARYGAAAMAEWRGVQKDCPDLVAEILARYGIDADTHSHEGETCVAHRAGAFDQLREEAEAIRQNYGVEVELMGPSDLPRLGMNGPQFFGAMRMKLGFALNPLKYVLGLAAAAQRSVGDPRLEGAVLGAALGDR